MSFDTPVPPYNAPDPHATYVSFSCFDFLLIELVPMAHRLASELAAREEEWTRGGGAATSTAASGAGAGLNKRHSTNAGALKGTAAATTTAITSPSAGAVSLVDDEETREAVFYRLETLGYRVGLGVVERFSRDRPRFTDALDVIKFLCKDLWTLVFRKQIDNLKTNHRGIYVLTDNTFKPLTRMSLAKGQEGSLERAQPFLYFPAGLIRGALASMGINASVHAETSALPGATFQIRTAGAKS